MIREQRVLATLPLPIMGLISDAGYQAVENTLNQMLGYAHEMGVPAHIHPFIALSFIALPVIDFGILREKSKDDCRHIAVAILTGCDIIVSWNFKQIVNPKTMRGVKMVTTSERYKDLMICTPTMLVEGEI